MATSPAFEARPGAASAEDPAEQWRRLLNSTTDEAFCGAWLALLCAQLRDVSAGVVLLPMQGANTFGPVALWPEAPRDLSHFGAAAEKALAERRGIVQRAGEQAMSPWHVAYPLVDEQTVLAVVALEIPSRSEAQVQDMLRRLHWGMGWLQERLNRRAFSAVGQKLHRIGSVMEVVATVLGRSPMQQTLFEVTNLIARELRVARVAIGFHERAAVRVVAMSDAAWFEKNTQAVKHYVAAMEEAVDQLSTVSFSEDRQGEAAETPCPAHVQLAKYVGARAVISLPLLLGAKCLGVLTVERDGPEPFTASELDWLDALTGLLPPAIDQKRRADRGFLPRLRDDFRKLMTRFFGPRHLLWKFSGAAAVLLLAALVLIDIDYRVSAKTVIEGEIQRAAVAPFDGFVAASFVRAGDVVRKGQVLCALEDRDLLLERDRWSSEHEQRQRELREALAKHDLTQIQIIGAQVRQAEAQLALVEEKLARARVVAPFDGVVISGDLSQLIGSPVELGKKLFEIAPLQGYRVILQVDETEIRNVRVGQTGHLLVSGIAGEPLPFTVSKVTPVATAADGSNFFRVEARLRDAPANLRPGMQGVGKIDAGERRLWWALTHGFTDWLRITLWRWMP